MAQTYDIFIDNNANFRMFLSYRNPDNTAINITGYTSKFKIKDKVGGATLLNADSYVTIGNAAEGLFIVNIPVAVTSVQTWEQGVYDIVTTSPGGIATLLSRGRAFVVKGVS